mgnify:FL=1
MYIYDIKIVEGYLQFDLKGDDLMNVFFNNFKNLKWFYKILFILSIICPIVLFIFRICTGFFSYTHDFNGLPYKFYDTPFYQVFINILKTYQIFQPIIIIIYNLIIVKKDKYNFSAFLINIILFILGIDDFLQYIKMFFLGLFLEIYNL